MTRLQSVLCAAARFVLQLPSHAPVSADMRDTLHWLSYPQRITFKLRLLTYKCLHRLAPPCLSQFCQLLSALSGWSQLCSAEVHQLFIPRIRSILMGSLGFYYDVPASWNALPSSLCNPSLTLTEFRLILKTVL